MGKGLSRWLPSQRHRVCLYHATLRTQTAAKWGDGHRSKPQRLIEASTAGCYHDHPNSRHPGATASLSENGRSLRTFIVGDYQTVCAELLSHSIHMHAVKRPKPIARTDWLQYPMLRG
jgi:hypothetical protein